MTATAWYARGPRGAGIQTGAGAPSPTLGDDGDVYVNTTNGDLYERAAGVWAVSGNIKGPTGLTGRGYSGVTIAGNDLAFAGSDGVTDTVTVPAIASAAGAASAAAASASAATGSATASADSATAAASSASAAAASAAAAAAEGVVTGSVNGAATSLIVWTGTAAQFAALASKNPKTIYIWPGGISIGDSRVYIGKPSRTYTVTVDHTKVSAALTGFPLFVDLSNMPSAFWAAVGSGGDIRCYAGATELPREVVSCDKINQLGELHIKTDLSTTADTVITITVDGESADYAASGPFGRNAVWSNGFVVVSHDGGLTDSTANGLNGTPIGTVGDQVEGKIGKTAQDYLATGEYSFGTDAKLNISSVTLSAWLKDTNTGAGIRRVIAKQNQYSLFVVDGYAGTQDYTPSTGGTRKSTSNVSDGTWHCVGLVCQPGTQETTTLFVDGEAVLTTNSMYTVTTEPAFVGGRLVLNDPGYQAINAVIDEVRIANVVRSPEWIATEYANQVAPASFYTVT